MKRKKAGPLHLEWELDTRMVRTGRWRRRQFYAKPGAIEDSRPLSERKPCEWRSGPAPT